MTGFLRQMNKSHKKTGVDKNKPKCKCVYLNFFQLLEIFLEIETGDGIGGNSTKMSITTSGNTRYKLPQSCGLGNTPSTMQNVQLSEDFNMILNSHGQYQQDNGKVSFLMKHRIKQEAGDINVSS